MNAGTFRELPRYHKDTLNREKAGSENENATPTEKARETKDSQELQCEQLDSEIKVEKLVSHLRRAKISDDSRAIKLQAHYVPVNIQGCSELALLDTGNTYRSAISEEFFWLLGFGPQDLRPLRVSVQTAQAGSTLQVLGEPLEPLWLNFSDIDLFFSFSPVVIRNLAMHVNVSGPFMAKHQ